MFPHGNYHAGMTVFHVLRSDYIEQLHYIQYKNFRCGMFVHETAIHQMTVKFKLLQVPLQPSIMNMSLYHIRTIKGPKITKYETSHKPQQSATVVQVQTYEK